MSYRTANAAYAYDMDAADLYAGPAARAMDPERAPRTSERPGFDVYTGEGREADQVVSPAFIHVMKVFCVLAALFFVVGMARVAIAGATAAQLNSAASETSELSDARDKSSDLEAMRSVYGADSRIRDLATSTLGMVEPEGHVTLDLGSSAQGE